MIKYDIERREADSGNESEKGKKMFTAIQTTNLKSIKDATLKRKPEWGFDFVYSDKNKFEMNAVRKDVSLS